MEEMRMAGDPRKAREAGAFLSFDDVQERMVEAMRLWWRSPDRERAWLSVRSLWPDIVRHHHFGDYADTEAEPRPLPLGRDDVAEMETVGEWMRFAPERDRKLVAVGLAHLAGGKKRVPWIEVWKALGRGKPGPEGLRKRYGAALADITRAANAQKSGRGTVKREKVTAEK